MKYKKLGKAKVDIPVIGQGCMGIGGYLTRDTSRDEVQLKALKLGIDMGMTLIDTAETYGGGHSEELVGKAIAGMRDKVFIATKFAPEHNGYTDVLKSADQSLRRLKTDYIDLYQLHWPNPGIPLEETMRAMEKLIGDGKVRFAGVCNLSLKELKKARAALTAEDIVSLQVEYNLFDRTVENKILPYCQREDITLIAYSPLDQGKIGGDKKAGVLQNIADKYGKTISQVTLNWLVSHDPVIAIPKATNPEHVKQNALSIDFNLTSEELAEIDRVFAQKPVNVPVERICVIPGGEGNRQVYRTLEEALENKLGFVPSPAELARDIKAGEDPKPVRVRKSTDNTGRYDYDLVEGRVRYWAWVIAYNGIKPIPVLIRDN